MINLWARFSPSCPLFGLIFNIYWEFIIRKGKLPVGINPAQLPPGPATLLALCGRRHMAQGICSCLANSSPACGIIHWGKLPRSYSQSVLASWASRTSNTREQWGKQLFLPEESYAWDYRGLNASSWVCYKTSYLPCILCPRRFSNQAKATDPWQFFCPQSDPHKPVAFWIRKLDQDKI